MWAICALGLLALTGVNVNAAALDPYPTRCGYGYQACPQGYDCVETSKYVSSCQKTDYLSGPVSKRQTAGSTFTPITGIPQKVVERRPIAVLQNSYPDVFNMFILALESLQARQESNDTSYYQVSGIHGYPFIPWQYGPERTVNPGMGYCTHGSAIFTTWHRPYLVLIEQLLQAEAVTIAKKFTGSAATKYLAAADEVRMPYWDWASDDTKSHLPQAVTATQLTVIKPGSQGTGASNRIPNPLYNYRFLNPQPADSGFRATTVRASNADSVMFNTFQGRKDSTYRLFSDTGYNQFSGDCEGIHNGVHVNVGGDMVAVARSAFDPIFWLHKSAERSATPAHRTGVADRKILDTANIVSHCNIDRLMAMYQASHPGVALTPRTRSQTFALGGDGPDDLSTPLYPFRRSNGVEWTSNDIKTAESIFATGYAYPEVPAGRSGESLRIFTTERANQLYGPNLQAASFVGNESGAAAPTARREWTANVLVDSHELPGSQRVLIFLGDKTEDNLVGVAGVFADQASPSNNNRFLNISIPLTDALVDKNVALRPEDAVPTLAKQLQWTVEQANPDSTSQIPTTDLKSLTIAVSSTITEFSEDKTKLPVVTDPLTHFEPTAGKEGGLQPGEKPVVGSAAPAVAVNGTTTA